MQKIFCFVFSEPLFVYPLRKQGYTVYNNQVKLLWKKIIREILKRIKIYWKGFLFLWEIKYNDIAQFTHIVVSSFSTEKYFCDFIEYNFPSKKLIIYSGDTIRNKEISIKKVNIYKPSNWQIFSFDEQDCLVFGLKYNPMFFCAWEESTNINSNSSVHNENGGIFFIGLSKDREEKVMFLKRKFDEMNIKNKIILIDSSRQDYMKKIVPYEEVLMEVKNSDILLDIVREGQSGATQRELEAIGFKKKLITDNQYIKNRKYYNENNIFIVDWSKQDVLEGIEDFLAKPFEKIEEEIMNYYSIKNWLVRFLE